MPKQYEDVDVLINDIVKYYDLYEDFIWKNSNDCYRLIVQVDANFVRIILGDGSGDISFNQFPVASRMALEYIAISMFRYAFRDSPSNCMGNVFSSSIHIPYLMFEVYGSEMLGLIKTISGMHNKSMNNELDNDLYCRYHKLKVQSHQNTGVIDINQFKKQTAVRKLKRDGKNE